jgi:hypothetical protein
MKTYCLRKSAILMVLGVSILGQLAAAQSALVNIPRQSQHSVLMQRIGITDITINYHRPLAGGRKILGGVVPYGEVWRAGANENTTITFTDPVTLEGKSLDKGTYGMHMIPGEHEWTIIFSKMSDAWGSFTYDEKEDALRIMVKPRAEEMHDALTYDFDDLKPESAVATLRWEKVAVPFKIEVNVNDLVAANLHKQLRGLAQYTWDGWDDSAQYLLSTKAHLEDALAYEEKSIQAEDRYDNWMTKSQILEAMSKTDEAAAAKKTALAKASPFQLHSYARLLQGQKKQEEAFAIFGANFKSHPEMWFVHSGEARVLTARGDFSGAAREMQKAHDLAPTQFQAGLAGMVKRLENKEDINK